MIENAIILDLDDTIFRTKSMDPSVFVPFFDHLAGHLRLHCAEAVIDNIIADLWHMTWDTVLTKYNIPRSRIMPSIQFLESLALDLNITTYPDYNYVRGLPHPKFLVTTSLTSLQEAKIRALGIENDFTGICINDTFKSSQTKLDIFKQLVAAYNLVPEKTYVVGDNADSEIRAGNSLNMVTIQILRDNVIKGNNARHYIQSFNELAHIFR